MCMRACTAREASTSPGPQLFATARCPLELLGLRLANGINTPCSPQPSLLHSHLLRLQLPQLPVFCPPPLASISEIPPVRFATMASVTMSSGTPAAESRDVEATCKGLKSCSQGHASEVRLLYTGRQRSVVGAVDSIEESIDADNVCTRRRLHRQRNSTNSHQIDQISQYSLLGMFCRDFRKGFSSKHNTSARGCAWAHVIHADVCKPTGSDTPTPCI